MALRKYFYIFQDPDVSSSHLIYIDDFYKYFDDHCKNQNLHIRRSHLLRSFKSVKIADGKEAVSVRDILRYCFNHSNDYGACEEIVCEVEKSLLFSRTSTGSEYIRSSLELYKLIAKSHFENFEDVLHMTEIDEHTTETLVKDHKSVFTNDEWKKIVWFEIHFCSDVLDKGASYEELLKSKWSKYSSLLSFKKCKAALEVIARKHLKNRFQRQQAAKLDESESIVVGQTHLYSVIDSNLSSLVQDYYPETFGIVVAFETNYDMKEEGFSVIIEVTNNTNEEVYCYLCHLVKYELQKRHQLSLKNVMYVDADTTKRYVKKASVARFHLRDDIQLEKIGNYVFRWENTDEQEEPPADVLNENHDGMKCESCFSTELPPPLTIKNFSIMKEWHLDVPIEMQLILGAFINTETLRRCNDTEKYLQNKLEKLYTLYDGLLNILNKNYIGLFQQANTDELLYDYKSIKSVFSVTAASGATASHVKAEVDWKKRADEDILYYNTYLKPQPITYHTDAGLETKSVSLRQCHTILMLDNLVRLTTTRNPNRSENPSKQLCTLPITIQGLPVDAAITESWHDQDICNGTFNCQCKKKTCLSKEDIPKALLVPTASEKATYVRFQQLCTWGYKEIWRKMPDDLSQTLEGSAEVPTVTETLLTVQMDTTDIGQESEFEDDVTDEDIDLGQILQQVDIRQLDVNDDTLDAEIEEEVLQESAMNISVENELSELETSFLNLSVIDEQDLFGKDIVESFGFSKFCVPQLLCRHPPPATGRDDDISKIREILDDVLLKMGYLTNTQSKANRILCGPDHKIGNCLLKLMVINEKYTSFLPEFPLLHLRKSMITILFSSYKEAGLVHILQFMRDEDKSDWSSLVSAHHIDAATRNVRRIGLSLHIAFLIAFAQQLPSSECEDFLNDMVSMQSVEMSNKWSNALESFMAEGSANNATFALHNDIMKHCDNVAAVAFAERLGGTQGYELLLSIVKSSLAFSFVNGASSYGPYCVQLLYHHYSAGHFHSRLKQSLFSTPIGNSTKNFACDTKREMDHLEAIKGFRSGSTLDSVTVRMSLIDSLNEASQKRNESIFSESEVIDNLGWSLTDVDLNHIYPTALLILKRGSLSLEKNHVPFNVYSERPTALPPSILDANSNEVGEFLIKKYLVKEKLFQYQEADLAKELVNGPVELVNRAKRTKGTTMKRTLKSKVITLKSDREIKEEARKKLVEKKSKELDCLTSDVNACQALLKPDLSKPKVFKSLGMQRALLDQVNSCIKMVKNSDNSSDTQEHQYMLLNTLDIPQSYANNVRIATMEFAGVKFKTGHCISGRQYCDFAESLIRKTIKQFPNISKLVICEEKYSYTPDDFKCATRVQRQGKAKSSIEHLKEAKSVLNDSTFNKDILTKTAAGKALISTYLAENLDKISLKQDVCLVLDSEFVTKKCHCENPCTCKPAAIPICKTYHKNSPPEKAVALSDIKQCKGEAEMSQVDWLIAGAAELKSGEAAASILTSGDIDSVYIHLFALSLYWPRDANKKFRNPVYIILQKQGCKQDIYSVTLMLELFGTCFSDLSVGVKLATALCIGGNDFIPKFQQISHKTIVHTLLKPNYRHSMFSSISSSAIVLNDNCFVSFVKELYCPSKLNAQSLSYDTVRALTIGKKVADTPSGYTTKDPKRWLPPESAIKRLAELVQLQIDYLLTVGFHDKEMPAFLSKSCLKKCDDKIEYDFGPDAHFVSVDNLPVFKKTTTMPPKRSSADTPQKGERKKQPKTSTPVKNS